MRLKMRLKILGKMAEILKNLNLVSKSQYKV